MSSVQRNGNARVARAVLVFTTVGCLLAIYFAWAGRGDLAHEPAGSPRDARKAPATGVLPAHVEQTVAPSTAFNVAPGQGRTPDRLIVGVPPAGEELEILKRIRNEGILGDTDFETIRFGSLQEWQELGRLWDSQSTQVHDAWKAHHELGKRLAKKRLDAGDFKLFKMSEYKPGPQGHYAGPWNDRNHPDEWLTNVTTFEEEQMIVRHVRIAPGQEPDLDEAGRLLKAWNEVRADSARRYIEAHRLR
jgi:hypothetical protein